MLSIEGVPRVMEGGSPDEQVLPVAGALFLLIFLRGGTFAGTVETGSWPWSFSNLASAIEILAFRFAEPSTELVGLDAGLGALGIS